MLIKALALVSSFQGKIIQRVMNKKCEKRLAHIVMREPEVGKIPPVAIAVPKPSLIPCGDDKGIPPISIMLPQLAINTHRRHLMLTSSSGNAEKKNS